MWGSGLSCSAAQSCATLCNPHELQQARLPCPSLSPRVCSNSCPLSQQCHPAISSFGIPFSCPQSFPPLRSFPMSRFFASGGQSIGTSALAIVLPMNVQDWLVWSPCCPRDFPESSLVQQFESVSSLVLNLLYGPCLTMRGQIFFFFFAQFVAAHLKECNKTRKGKEGTCLRSMMAKEKWAAGSPGLTHSGHS